MTVYRARKEYVLGNCIVLIFPAILTLITVFEGSAAEKHQWLGLSIFWFLAVIFSLIPLATKIEVGGGQVRLYFFGYNTKLFCEIR